MKKFILNILSFAIIVFLCLFVIAMMNYFIVGSQYSSLYQASVIDKINRLKSINEPKIILVGNSNLSFGIDSEMIEKAIGMPVVNLGLHGGLGNEFHENIAKENINNGDIVILCHSRYNDEADKIEDPLLACITIDNHIELLKMFRLEDYFSILISYPNYIKKSIFLWLTHKGNTLRDGCYARDSFNKYGDIVYKPDYMQMNVEDFFANTNDNEIFITQISNKCIKRLNDYNKYIVSRGATLIVAGYPIAYGKYSSFKYSDVKKFENELRNALDCEVISDYTNYLFPYEYFYNTKSHLTKKGAEVRTKQLISDIEKWKSKH